MPATRCRGEANSAWLPSTCNSTKRRRGLPPRRAPASLFVSWSATRAPGLPRRFCPAFSSHSSPPRQSGRARGLGLATVYGIVQQHQGWIEVSSKVGEGTTFKVFLPAIATPAQPAAASQAGGDVRGGTETILLVEDEHAVRMTTRRMLESRGYRIHEATCAREALELWHSHAREIDLLLTDIIMPHEMTGRDLAARLWELGR